TLTPNLLFLMVVFLTKTCPAAQLIPAAVKPSITQSSIETFEATRTLIPFWPEPYPLIERPLRRTTFKASDMLPVLVMVNPLPFTAATPAITPVPSIVMDFVILSVPNPPASRAFISPFAAVLEIAPANVLQGAYRLQAFASSPTPETQVRFGSA